jgi:hypothetical protein
MRGLRALLVLAVLAGSAVARAQFNQPPGPAQRPGPGGPFLPTTPTNPWATRLGETSQWRLTGSHVNDYAAGMDYRMTREGRPSGFLASRNDDTDGLASVTQKQDAKPFRGKRIRFGAWVRVADVTGWSGLWMRIDDGAQRALGFDNMQDRPLTGTQDWKWCEVVLDVPNEAATISYGLLLQASGQAWANGLTFEEVKNDVPSTDLMKPRAKPPPPPTSSP